MHVATEAVEIVQALAQPSPNYGYSRGLAPWCLNRPTFGSLNNSNFWSCGMIAAREPTLTYVTTSNYSLLSSVALGASDVHNILDFVDTDGIPIAILAPNNVPAGIDYYASTYGVSTQCQLVRNSSCTIRPGKITDTKVPMAGFNCSDDGVDLDVSGNIYPVATQAYEFNFHRFINEPPPFASGATSYQFKEDLLDMAANLSDSEAPTVFKNPFRLLVAMNIFSDAARTMDLSDSDNRRFVILDVDFLMPICNSTGMFLSSKGNLDLFMLICPSMGRKLRRSGFENYQCYSNVEQRHRRWDCEHDYVPNVWKIRLTFRVC